MNPRPFVAARDQVLRSAGKGPTPPFRLEEFRVCIRYCVRDVDQEGKEASGSSQIPT